MSFQGQPQQQQPAQVYPTTTTVTNQPPNSHHSNGNGSFGTVFIVLAVILVISALACFLGRLCNRRQQNQNPAHLFRPKEGDVELGLDKRIPSVRSNGFRVGNGYGHGHGLGGRVPSPKPPMNSGGADMKSFEMKIGDRGNLRAVA